MGDKAKVDIVKPQKKTGTLNAGVVTQTARRWKRLRPHVIHLEQQASREPALQGRLQGMEVIVAVVRLQTEGAEASQWALARRRVNEVHGVLTEEVMSLAADVGDLRGELVA